MGEQLQNSQNQHARKAFLEWKCYDGKSFCLLISAFYAAESPSVKKKSVNFL